MSWAFLVHLMQWVLAFLALDRTFRTIPVEPDTLRSMVRHYRHRFALIGGLACLAGAAVQVWTAGGWGWALAAVGWLPWWILWRFGWRKQFTFLYQKK